MRKIIICLIAIITSSTSILAQKEAGENSIILKGGVNYTDMFDCSGKWGYFGGAEYEHYLTKRKALSLAATYNAYKIKQDWDGSRDISLNYVSVPLMYNYYVVKGLCLKVGVDANVLVSDHVKGNYGFYYGYNGSYKSLLKDQADNDETVKVNKVRFGIPFGLSYEYSNIILDLRAEYGLTDVSRHDKIHYSMNAAFITLGFRL